MRCKSADLTRWDGAPDDPEVQKVLLRLGLLIGKEYCAQMRFAAAVKRGDGRSDALSAHRSRAHGRQPFTYKEAEDALRAAARKRRCTSASLTSTRFGARSTPSPNNAAAAASRRLMCSSSARTPAALAAAIGKKTRVPSGRRRRTRKQVFERHLAAVRAPIEQGRLIPADRRRGG